MAKPRTPQTEKEDFLTRVDPYRSDEDTGGQAAPPLRPREDIERRDVPPKTSQR